MCVKYTQGHETSRNRPALGTATPTGHPVAQGGYCSVGNRLGRGCLRELSIPMGRGLPKAEAPGIAVTTDPRSSPSLSVAQRERLAALLLKGPLAKGLSHRFMDLETYRAADPPAVRGAVPSLSCLEAPDPVGMELSEARMPSAATGRGRDRTMETILLAPYKKRRAPWCPPRLS